MPFRYRTLPLLLIVACSPFAADRAAPDRGATRAVSDADRADSIARARQDSINRAEPGYIVDSILPIAEEMRRFRAAVGGAPALSFQHAAASRDELAAQFARAIAAADTVALRRLSITPREFIDLVYPESPYTAPPYRQAPGLLWSQIQGPSGSGFRRLLERHGGRPFRIVSLTCPAAPELQGANRLHHGCLVRFVADNAPARQGRLFGTIIEREGRFKFVSFANMY